MAIHPMMTDGTASAMSGAVTTLGDSFKCSLAWGSILSSPWKTTSSNLKL